MDSIGPTLLDLLQITHTEVHNAAFVFMSHGSGIVAGLFVVMPLMARICPELLMAGVCLLQGVATAAIPWLDFVPLMCISLFLQGLAIGIAGVGKF